MDCRVGDYLTDGIRLLRVVSVRQIGSYPTVRKLFVLEDAIEFNLDDRGERVYKTQSFPEVEVSAMKDARAWTARTAA